MKESIQAFLFTIVILSMTVVLILITNLAGMSNIFFISHRFVFALFLAALLDLAVCTTCVILGYNALTIIEAHRTRPLLPSIPKYITSFGIGLIFVYLFTFLFQIDAILSFFGLVIFLLLGPVEYLRTKLEKTTKRQKKKERAKAKKTTKRRKKKR